MLEVVVQCAQNIVQLACLAAADALDLACGVAALLLAMLAITLVGLAAQLSILALAHVAVVFTPTRAAPAILDRYRAILAVATCCASSGITSGEKMCATRVTYKWL